MKILLVGFYGEGNLGDETILQAILACLPPSCAAIVTSGSMIQTSAMPIKRRGFASWPYFLQAAASCRYAVLSGGILQDWSFEGVTWFALRVLAASVLGCQPVLYGAGIGPLRSKWAQQITKKALRRISNAWLRNNESITTVNELSDLQCNLGADWSWLVPIKYNKTLSQKPTLALNIRPWKSSQLGNLVKEELGRNNCNVIGLACRKEDFAAIKKNAKNATVFQPASFEDFANSCSNFSHGLAMRYHAALAMLRAGLPLKVAAYDTKVLSLASDAEIVSLKPNQVGSFQKARPGFCAEHEQRGQIMRQAFVDMLLGEK